MNTRFFYAAMAVLCAGIGLFYVMEISTQWRGWVCAGCAFICAFFESTENE
jgi:hypothetical protein